MPYGSDEYRSVLDGVFEHLGSDGFGEELFQPVKNKGNAENAPAGGFWASPIGDGRTTWSEHLFSEEMKPRYEEAFWCTGEYFVDDYEEHRERFESQPRFRFRLKPNANILLLRHRDIIKGKIPLFDNDPVHIEDEYDENPYTTDDKEVRASEVMAALLDAGKCGQNPEYLTAEYDAWKELGCHIDFERLAKTYDGLLYLCGESKAVDAICDGWMADTLLVFNPKIIEPEPADEGDDGTE